MVRPLDGVRVLDLTRLLPGACATLLLADLGADVIKLEDPRGGDPMRRMPPLAVDGTSVYFHVFNRNKRSITLDLRSPNAAAVFDALVSRVDVVVDSFRPRTARRLGVDAAALRARHPRLVCASISGFGHTGPYVDRAAHDINYDALVALEPKFWAGFCERIGRPDLAPLQAAEGEERARVLAAVRAVMRTRTREEWLAVFGNADVCLTPVNNFEEALADPHLRDRSVLVRVGSVTYLAPTGIVIRPAPALGGDTDDVLERAGVGVAERTRLRANGVI